MVYSSRLHEIFPHLNVEFDTNTKNIFSSLAQTVEANHCLKFKYLEYFVKSPCPGVKFTYLPVQGCFAHCMGRRATGRLQPKEIDK